jgi:uncharacterized protein (TIGR02001 family)
MFLRSSLVAVALIGSAVPAMAADPAPFTGNITLASDYKFRGFTQTNYKPALQGGFDYAHKSGFYLGNWNSNVEQTLYNGASLEMDVYGGFKGTMGSFTYDVGAIYYAYPGSVGPKIDNKEIYFGVGAGPVTAKLFYSLGDYFSTQAIRKASATPTPNGATDGTIYLDVGATHDLGNGWGINAHVGYLNVKNGKVNGLVSDTVTDYKVGLTKDVSGWVFGGSYITTSKKDFFLTGATGVGNSWAGAKPAGDARLLVSLAKTF